MRIRRVRIQGYRCLRDVDIRFDDITTFIGPNGVGKSSVLRALDWFFNGDRGRPLTDEDVSADSADRRISVEVEFGDLNPLDRLTLGKYAADGRDTVQLWRRWEDGDDKLSGHALAYPPFEALRQIPGARERRAAYNRMRTECPEMELPAVRNAAELDEALDEWERTHPELLESTELDAANHFFGFAGQAKMTGLFDYVFVSADLRADEEGRDAKGSVIGRILDQAIDRTQAEQEMADLQLMVNATRATIQSTHFGEQLETLSDDLTAAVSELTSGRSVHVSPLVQELRLPQVQFQVSVRDGSARTRIDQQGHGFQRALLISALRLLAESRAVESDRTIFLAIEEPELFQHPVQARAFAAVLRKIARETGRGVQIAYATHSPYFLETEGFAQVRRMTRDVSDGTASVRIASTTADTVADRLAGVLDPSSFRRQFMQVCLQRIPEALFARAVILVEGPTDLAVLEGCGLRADPLNRNGIVVVDLGGKSRIPLAHALLTELGVPCYAVFDGDADFERRARARQMAPDKIAQAMAGHRQENRRLVGYFGGAVEDHPATKVHEHYAVVHDCLETYLESDWPEWETARWRLVEEGRGLDGKHEDTYRQATVDAAAGPPAWLSDIINRVMDLCAED
ncbi:ATP-dependent endonuclease [Spirillospora sp. NPDC029432]|uniref:AAA family ATPase n=1 Tax=Spirillospora sp. NPDC029432 TaxID=3154599 RepID=UPI003451A14E